MPTMNDNSGREEPKQECSDSIHVSDHPLVATKMSILRDKGTESMLFRELASELSLLLGYEATADLLTTTTTATATDPRTQAQVLAEPVALVPVMRAGLGLLSPMLQLLPTATVFHMGIFRERGTLQPVEYYNKLPQRCTHQVCIVLDAMIATGGTVVAVVNALKEWGARRVKVVALCASAPGIRHLQQRHPDVQVYTAAIDEGLSEDGYIVPGLGDAGDRLYRTK